jgi:transcriptional regulator with XRE-family HTH domain
VPTPLGNRVRELRRKHGLTLEALAAKIESSKSYVWEIENKDVARPSAEKLSLIAAALGTTTEYLLGADMVTEADATDAAFFRRYREMDPKAKEQLRGMLKILDDKDP